MTIKLIATDMDGTLLKSDNTISPKTKHILIEAQKQGIRLVLASGRSYRKLMQYANELEMPKYGGFLIEVNGTAVYDLKHAKRTRYHELKKADAIKIFQALKPFEVEIMGLGDDSLYDYIPQSLMPIKQEYRRKHQLSDDYPWTAGAFEIVFDNRIGYPHQYMIQSGEEFPDHLNKIAAIHESVVLLSKLSDIKKVLQDDYWLGLTSPTYLEIMEKGVTKGNALTKLCERLNIDMADVIAFGDGENDIDMLKKVGTAVVMENALPAVKTYADIVCSSNQNDGLAETLQKYLPFTSKSDVF